MPEQHGDDRPFVVPDRIHERGVAQFGLRGIDLRTAIEEESHDVVIPCARCRHQQVSPVPSTVLISAPALRSRVTIPALPCSAAV